MLRNAFECGHDSSALSASAMMPDLRNEPGPAGTHLPIETFAILVKAFKLIPLPAQKFRSTIRHMQASVRLPGEFYLSFFVRYKMTSSSMTISSPYFK